MSDPTPLPAPTFSWSILLGRITTFGVGGFLSVFAASFTATQNWQQSLSNALIALVGFALTGATYDNVQWQNSVQNFKAQSKTVGGHDPVNK